MILETERLLLRPCRITDANDIYEYAQEMIVGQMAGWKPHDSLAETEMIIKEILMKDSLAIVLKDEKKVIGTVGLMARGEEIYELGYSLGKKYWGFGYGTESAKEMLHYAFTSGLAQIVITGHFIENIKSKKVIEKCGFKFIEVVKNGFLYYDNTYKDVWRYALTKDEYLEKGKDEECVR